MSQGGPNISPVDSLNTQEVPVDIPAHLHGVGLGHGVDGQVERPEEHLPQRLPALICLLGVDETLEEMVRDGGVVLVVSGHQSQ